MKMECFTEFQLMYLILDELNDENNKDNVSRYLTDANPYMRTGETSVDEAVYEDFKKKYQQCDNHRDYSYDFICDYFLNLDRYYGDVYTAFKTISKAEYIDTCNNILNNYPEELKKI